VHLIYFDESGNTGINLNDSEAPVFVLCALCVLADEWQDIEADLIASRDKLLPDLIQKNIEVHAKDIVNPAKKHPLFGKAADLRLKLFEDWMRVAKARKLTVFYKAIVKKRYARWLKDSFNDDVKINPQIAAFVFLAHVINEYLASQQPRSLGIFISDENREVVTDIEDAIRILRISRTRLRLSQIVEKGFFIESKKSVLLQLCDLCTFSVKKREEEKIGRRISQTNRLLAKLADPVVYRGREATADVIAWLQQQYAAK
jgi:Protein of unknown function (DUF3800)